MQNFFIWEADLEAAGLSACGMFSPTHLTVTFFCLVALGLALYFTRKMTDEQFRRLVLVLAVFVTVLECVKIGFNWVHGGFTPNRWLPLTFCSFSIYSYWLMASKNEKIRSLGVSFMAGGGIIGGLTFLVMPMTSVATYPMLHFQSFYSMVFHTLMMYVGISCVTRGYFSFGKGGYRRYLTAALPALGLALVVSLLYFAFTGDIATCNMMFLVHPYRLGDMIPFIATVYNEVWGGGLLYSLGALAVYSTLPYFIPCGVSAHLQRVKSCAKA